MVNDVLLVYDKLLTCGCVDLDCVWDIYIYAMMSDTYIYAMTIGWVMWWSLIHVIGWGLCDVTHPYVDVNGWVMWWSLIHRAWSSCDDMSLISVMDIHRTLEWADATCLIYVCDVRNDCDGVLPFVVEEYQLWGFDFVDLSLITFLYRLMLHCECFTH